MIRLQVLNAGVESQGVKGSKIRIRQLISQWHARPDPAKHRCHRLHYFSVDVRRLRAVFTTAMTGTFDSVFGLALEADRAQKAGDLRFQALDRHDRYA